MTPSAPRISEDELARLEELAGKATPGPWKTDEDRHVLTLPSDQRLKETHGSPPSTVVAVAHRALAGQDRLDAVYIAALSPDVVLRLIAAARSAPAAGLDVERLAKALDRGRHPLDALTRGVPETARRIAREYAALAAPALPETACGGLDAEEIERLRRIEAAARASMVAWDGLRTGASRFRVWAESDELIYQSPVQSALRAALAAEEVR